MTNKNFMIFQTAVRKYVDIHERSESGNFFYPQISVKNQKQFWTKNARNFFNALIFLKFLRIQK
jgi:hypothetical protein